MKSKLLFLSFFLSFFLISINARKISGTVNLRNNAAIPLANVPVRWNNVITAYTNDQGYYEFTVPNDEDITVSINDGGSNTNSNCGMSAADLDFIQKFILTGGGPSAPVSSAEYFKIIACDVNKSNTISAADASWMYNCSNGLSCNFPAFRAMTETSYNYAQSLYNGGGGGNIVYPVENQIFIAAGSSDVTNANFFMVKFGDPVTSYCATSQYKSIDFDTETKAYTKDENTINEIDHLYLQGNTIIVAENLKEPSIKVYTLSGSEIFTGNNQSIYDVGQLPSGMYIVKIFEKEKLLATKKVVK